jgi:hypothetical protein
MPLDPSYLVMPLLQWVREKILSYLKPFRVDYNESILKIELHPWTHMPALLGALLVLMALVNIYSGSWVSLLVVIFFGGSATVLASLALRRIRTIIVANKPQQWIRVTEHGIFWTETKLTKVKNLRAITYERVFNSQMVNISVMTGEGSTNLLENEGENEAAEIVGYLNAFLFDGEEAEGEMQQMS